MFIFQVVLHLARIGDTAAYAGQGLHFQPAGAGAWVAVPQATSLLDSDSLLPGLERLSRIWVLTTWMQSQTTRSNTRALRMGKDMCPSSEF